MAHPVTEYLLLLAEDSNELDTFNNAEWCDRVDMATKKHHLGTTQAEHLADVDTPAIVTDINAEWGHGGRGGTHYTIQLALALKPCKKHG